MARLFATMSSDTHKTPTTICGNQALSFRLYYGSERDSKIAVYVSVTYPKGSKRPVIKMVKEEVK